jgi:hypothetical protein
MSFILLLQIRRKTMNTEEAKQQIQELQKLRRQTRRMRLVTLVAVLVIVLTGVSAIINAAYSLTLAGPKQDKFVKTLGANLQRDMLPVVEKIASRSAGRLRPAVQAEVQKVNARAPEVADVALRELNQMAEELPAQGGKIVDQTISGTMHKRDAKLRLMFPGVYDKNINLLLDNLTLEAQDQLAQSGETVFGGHLNSVQHILANLDKIQKTEPVVANQNVDPWQVTFMFMDLFVTEFRDLAPVEPATLVAQTKTSNHAAK